MFYFAKNIKELCRGILNFLFSKYLLTVAAVGEGREYVAASDLDRLRIRVCIDGHVFFKKPFT